MLFQMHVLMNFIDSTVTFFIFYFVKMFFKMKIDKILIKIDIYHKKISELFISSIEKYILEKIKFKNIINNFSYKKAGRSNEF